jgi:hypothetical protein
VVSCGCYGPVLDVRGLLPDIRIEGTALSGNMPFSCTFRNSSPNCSDGGTSDAQVAICARAEWHRRFNSHKFIVAEMAKDCRPNTSKGIRL